MAARSITSMVLYRWNSGNAGSNSDGEMSVYPGLSA
jgi:hypothetical protein